MVEDNLTMSSRQTARTVILSPVWEILINSTPLISNVYPTFGKTIILIECFLSAYRPLKRGKSQLFCKFFLWMKRIFHGKAY